MKKIFDDAWAKEIAQEIINKYNPQNMEELTHTMEGIFEPVLKLMTFENNLLRPEKLKEIYHREGGRPQRKSVLYKKSTPVLEAGELPNGGGSVTDNIVEEAVLSLYAEGICLVDIVPVLGERWGWFISYEQAENIVEVALQKMQQWQQRTLLSFYPFLFMKRISAYLQEGYKIQKVIVYMVLGFDLAGYKNILGFWIGTNENDDCWTRILNEMKLRGLDGVGFIVVEDAGEFNSASRDIFPSAVWQKNMTALLDKSLQFVMRQDFREITSDLKRIYGAVEWKSCQKEFSFFKRKWEGYPEMIGFWQCHFYDVKQLFSYGDFVRKVLYMKNPSEGMISGLKKRIEKNPFKNKNSLEMMIYFYCEKWYGHKIKNWQRILMQLNESDQFATLVEKYG